MAARLRLSAIALALASIATASSCAQRPAERAQGAVANGPLPRPSASARRMEIPPINGHTSWITGIAIDPSHRRVVTAGGDRRIKIWSVSLGLVERTIETADYSATNLHFVDDSRVIGACSDGKLRGWRVETGDVVFETQAHRGTFRATYASDRPLALTAAIDATERSADGLQEVKTWNLVEGKLEKSARVPGDVGNVAWSRDRRFALISTYRNADGAFVVDLEDAGRVVRKLPPLSENGIDALFFDRDGRRAIVSHAGGPTTVFDLATGAQRERANADLDRTFVAADGSFVSVTKGGLVARQIGSLGKARAYGPPGLENPGYAVSNDATTLVHSESGVLRVVDAASGDLICRFGEPIAFGWWSAIAPDGWTAAIASRSELRLVSLETGATLRNFDVSNGTVAPRTLAFTASGTRLIGVIEMNELRAWDVASGTVRASRSVPTTPWVWVWAIKPFPDQRTALAGIGGGAIRIDTETLETVSTYPIKLQTSPAAIGISANGDTFAVAAAPDRLELWDSKSAQRTATLAVRTDVTDKRTVSALAFHPSGKLLAAGERDCGGKPCDVRLYDLPSGKLLRTLTAGRRDVGRLAFIDDRRLVVGSTSGELAVWDVTTGAQLAADGRHRTDVHDVLAVDGTLISASTDSSILLTPIP